MAAKLSGVQVNEFSIFMGPAIVKWQRGETLYAIRCIPIGGYCAMEGENEDTNEGNKGNATPVVDVPFTISNEVPEDSKPVDEQLSLF